MSIEKRDVQHFAAIIVTGVVLAAGTGFLARSERTSLTAKVTEQREQLGLQEDGTQESLDRLENEVLSLQGAVARSAGTIPDEPQTGSVYASVAQAFGDLDVTGRNLSTESPEIYRDYGRVPLIVDFRGGYRDMIHALEDLERADRLIRIDQVHINSDPREVGQRRVHMELSAFFISDASGSGDVQ